MQSLNHIPFKRRALLAAVAALTIGLAACTNTADPDPRILRNFEKLKPGMSRSTVEQTMELRPVAQTVTTVLGVELVRLTWLSGNTQLSVDLLAEHLVSKNRISQK